MQNRNKIKFLYSLHCVCVLQQYINRAFRDMKWKKGTHIDGTEKKDIAHIT